MGYETGSMIVILPLHPLQRGIRSNVLPRHFFSFLVHRFSFFEKRIANNENRYSGTTTPTP